MLGDLHGATPGEAAVRRLLEKYQEQGFLNRHPTLRDDLLADPSASYTQWEAYLALHHGRKLYVFEPADNDGHVARTPRGKVNQPVDEARRQQRHRQRLDELGWKRESFHSIADLNEKVLSLDLPRAAESRPNNLPFATLGSLFKGREPFLRELREKLAGSASGAAAITTKAHALHGMGGVGKTRAAIEYAWRHEEDYRALLFVSAETPQKLAASLASLAGVLDMGELDGSPDDVRLAAVLQWLQDHRGWLAILDNVDTDEAAQAVRGRLASLSHGHVLITSRISKWAGSVEKLDLDVLDPDSAADYLLEATADDRHLSDDDGEVARRVAEQVGRLALGLEHAAAYINNHGLSLAEYLDEWRTNEDAVLAEFDLEVIDYPRELLVTWKLSADRLSDAARGLLDLFCWFAPEPIPESLLAETPADFPIANARRALDELVRYCLARREQDAPLCTLHRLVQATTRHHLRHRDGQGEAARTAVETALGWVNLCNFWKFWWRRRNRTAVETALRWVNAAFTGEPQDVRDWPRLDPLSPHAMALCDHAEQAGLTGSDYPTSRLLNDVGVLMMTKARYAEAEPLYRRALAIDKRAFGVEHPRVAIDLNNLAQLLQATNRLAEAEPLLKRVVEIIEANEPEKQPNYACTLINLGYLLQATNRLAEAEPLYRRAMAIDEQSYGAEHPNVARDLNSLALLLRATNRLAKAEPLMRRGLAIEEQSKGAEHPHVAIQLNNLAQLLQATNRLAEAEPLMRRALAINEHAYGTEHPKVAISLSDLAGLLQDTNHLAEAELLMRRALAIGEQSYGSQHPEVAVWLNNLAQLLQATNRLAEAEPLMRRMVEIFANFGKTTGHEHPHMQAAIENYGQLLQAMGRSESEIASALRDAVE